jgi:hypothetical protein
MTYSSTLSCLFDEQNPIPRKACNKCGALSDFLAIGVTVDNSMVVRCDRHLDTPPGVIVLAGEVVDFNYYDCSETDKAWLNYCPIRYDKTKPWGCEAYQSGGRGAALLCNDPSGACMTFAADEFAAATTGREKARLGVGLLRDFFDNNHCLKMSAINCTKEAAKKGGAA